MEPTHKNQFAEYISLFGEQGERNRSQQSPAVCQSTLRSSIKFANFVPLDIIFPHKPSTVFATSNDGTSNNVENGKFENVDRKYGANVKSDIEIDKNSSKLHALENFLRTGDHIIVVLKNIPPRLLNASPLLEELLEYAITKLLPKYHVVKASDSKVIHLNTSFKWALLSNDYVSDTKAVFITFSDILTLHLFQKTFEFFGANEKSDCGLKIHISKKLKKPLQLLEKCIKISDCQNMQKKLGDHLSSKYEEVMDKIGLVAIENENIDTDSKATQYSVDQNALLNIPDMLLENVKTSILDFKMSASHAEEVRVRKRKLQEEKRTRLKLQYLFNDLKHEKSNERGEMQLDIDKYKGETYLVEQHSKINEHHREKDNMNDDGDDDDDDDNIPGDDIGDLDFRKQMVQQRDNKIEDEFQRRIDIQKRSEQQQLSLFSEFNTAIKNDRYLKNVIPKARKKFIKSFVDNINNSTNTVDKSFRYYTNHSNYIKYRRAMRLLEEKRDDNDCEEQALERATTDDAVTFNSSFSRRHIKKMKISIKDGLKRDL